MRKQQCLAMQQKWECHGKVFVCCDIVVCVGLKMWMMAAWYHCGSIDSEVLLQPDACYVSLLLLAFNIFVSNSSSVMLLTGSTSQPKASWRHFNKPRPVAPVHGSTSVYVDI